jgi:hypothetical protein
MELSMIEIEGVVYLTAAEASRYLSISRCMFYNNVRGKVLAYELKFRKRPMYKKSELEAMRVAHPLAS